MSFRTGVIALLIVIAVLLAARWTQDEGRRDDCLQSNGDKLLRGVDDPANPPDLDDCN